MIAALLDYENEEDFRYYWSGHNANHHLLIQKKIQTNYSKKLELFNLDPIPKDALAFADWLNRHNQMHADVNFVLGFDGQNLSSVDFTDPDERLQWLEVHFADHLQWGNFLGVDS